jgi:cytochrome b561
MRYTGTARLLHWLTVALVLTAVLIGLFIVWGPEQAEATKLRIYTTHESIGVTILLLTLFRLYWRGTHPPPPLDPTLPRALVLAAHVNHGLLYALLIAMPVAGFLATNAWGFPLTWWWLVPLPDPIGRSEYWAPILSAVHDTMAIVLIPLIVLHASAALWHHLVRRDNTLRRML